MCGLSPLVYWSANFVWDMANYCIPAASCCLILRVFNIPAYTADSNFLAVVSLFLLYGWSITPMMYPATFFFDEPSTAYISMIVLNLFFGITCIMTSFLLQLFGEFSIAFHRAHTTLKYAFMVFPSFCLGRGLMDVAYNYYVNIYLAATGQVSKLRTPFQWDLINVNLVCMATIGLLCFIITLMIEYCLSPIHNDSRMASVCRPE